MGFAEDVFDPEMDAETVRNIESIPANNRTADQQRTLEEARANLRRYMGAGGGQQTGPSGLGLDGQK